MGRSRVHREVAAVAAGHVPLGEEGLHRARGLFWLLALLLFPRPTVGRPPPRSTAPAPAPSSPARPPGQALADAQASERARVLERDRRARQLAQSFHLVGAGETHEEMERDAERRKRLKLQTGWRASPDL